MGQNSKRSVHEGSLDNVLHIPGGRDMVSFEECSVDGSNFYGPPVHKNRCVLRKSGLSLRYYHTLAAVSC